MKKVLCAMMLFVAAILCLHQNVSAAEGATVTVNGDTLQAGSDAWKVTLDISGDTKITNGKIRVTYDSSQLKLVSTEAGSMMNGVLTDINDPVSGNKSEGEAVFVFASSAELDTNGTLFEITFQVLDSVKDGDSVTVSAKTEELQDNNNTVAVTDVPLNAVVGSQSNNNGNNSGNNNGGNNNSSTEPQSETASENGNNGNSSGSDNQGGSGIQTEAPSGNSSTSGSSSTSGGTSSGSSSTSGTQSSTVTSAKTGDNTNILRPLIIAVIALIVLIGGYVWSKKKKK
ncbi:MAG: cohesin domain-containing protein [Lachnospiraceae bacterium]